MRDMNGFAIARTAAAGALVFLALAALLPMWPLALLAEVVLIGFGLGLGSD